MKQMQKTFFALGTANTISVSYEESQETRLMDSLNRIKSRIFKLDDQLSLFKETSEITRINQAVGKKSVEVSPDTCKIVEKAIEFSKKSKGAFDISAGKLARLWRNAIKQNKVPDREVIKKYADLIGYQFIAIHKPRIGLSRNEQELDLGGIAKGYAADEARRILVEEEVTNAIINFGGTIIVMGDTRQIGIKNPFENTGKASMAFGIQNQAVVTSGLYEQCFKKDGCVYHHIINPQTGMPVRNGLVSVTVIGESALEMDALATAVFVMGLEEGIKLVADYHANAVLIDEAGDIFHTKGLGGSYI